jgi:hypothetical protein
MPAREVLDRILADQRGELHTSFPAQVVAYDAEAQTVDVRPALLREIPSDDPAEPLGWEQLPDLLAVQVMWPRAGGYAITFPIAVGDWVLIVCAEQCTLLWRTRATAPTHPGLHDPHGLNGCVALVGWHPDASRLSNVSTTDLVIGTEDGSTTVKVKKAGGTVTLGSDQGADFVALANGMQRSMQALADALTTAANAITPIDPATTGANAAVNAVATTIRTWASGVALAVGAKKVKAR